MSDIERVWTAAEILAWAEDVEHAKHSHYKPLFDAAGIAYDATETAAYLAKCTRLMAAFEKACTESCDCWGPEESCVNCGWDSIKDTLRAAIEGQFHK